MEKNRTEIFAKYQDEIHLLGRIGLTVGLGLLLGLPFAFGKVLNASVNWSAFWKGALQVLPVYLPSCVVEFMVYVPMMGAGASYLGFITGNMVNLKIPCVVNGRDICKPRDAMEKEIVATLSVAASALVNTGRKDSFNHFSNAGRISFTVSSAFEISGLASIRSEMPPIPLLLRVSSTSTPPSISCSAARISTKNRQ